MSRSAVARAVATSTDSLPGRAHTRLGGVTRRAGSRKTRAVRAPRRLPTCWAVVFSMLLTFFMTEMWRSKAGPFRDLSWKNRRSEHLSTMPVPQPLLQTQPALPLVSPISPGSRRRRTSSGGAAGPSVRSEPPVPRPAAASPEPTVALSPPSVQRQTAVVKRSAAMASSAKRVPGRPWSERTDTTSLLMVVGHMRGYENLKEYHVALVRSLEHLLGAPPTVCIVTYLTRDYESPRHVKGKDKPDFINPTHVAEAYGVNPSSVHVIEEAVAQNSDRYNDFIQQQTAISFDVHVGVFTSMKSAQQLCTGGYPVGHFDVIVRTRPDAIANGRTFDKAIRRMKQQFEATGNENLVAGCVRQRSLVGGDFSDVAFVGTWQFWELFVRTFDVYAQYDSMYRRPCTKFQKGQLEDATATNSRHGDCCQRRECAELFEQLKKPCKPDTAPPCSFTPESFLRNWMNNNTIQPILMLPGAVAIRTSKHEDAPVCTDT